MFLKHFNLAAEPFGVTPDPRYLYLGKQHREALASLVYGTKSNRGFVALIAKPGMGKTSLLYRYLEGLRGRARTAFVFRTDCDSREFIRHVLLDIGVDVAGKDLPAMHEAMNQVLVDEMRMGRQCVLVIDEAQNLDENVLESIRLLSNFETPWMKLMQIVVAGQPSLAEKLSRPSMTQLRQRITSVIRVEPLDSQEINAYIDHRLLVAGCTDPKLFSAGARRLIVEQSEGIPRKINNLCFNSLSLAYALQKKTVDRAAVVEVVEDLNLESLIEDPVGATRIRKSGSHRVDSVPPQLKEPRRLWLQTCTLRFAVATALIFSAVAGVNKGELRAANITEGSERRVTESFASQQIAAVATRANVDRKLGSIRVLQGQSLYRISVENLGRYNLQTLAELRNLNPWLSNPDYIRAGQQIRIPSARTSAEAETSVPEVSSSSPSEVGKE